VDAPNSLYSSLTNSSQIADRGEGHAEYNQQFTFGTAGGAVTSQFSGRLGVSKRVELGLVGNLSLTSPLSGAGGGTLHLGTPKLSPDSYRSGALFQATVGSGQDPSGKSNPVLSASGSYLASRGGDTAVRETDVNAGLAYSTFGTFGPGSTSVPHLLSAPLLAERNWYLDPSHANSAFVEGLVAPTVALGTLSDPHPLYGARVGAGTGFSTTATGSLFTISGNAFVDVTSRGFGAGGMISLTYGAKGTVFTPHDQ
jgi:hypothetical protein